VENQAERTPKGRQNTAFIGMHSIWSLSRKTPPLNELRRSCRGKHIGGDAAIPGAADFQHSRGGGRSERGS
jgi:hypothetical protein